MCEAELDGEDGVLNREIIDIVDMITDPMQRKFEMSEYCSHYQDADLTTKTHRRGR